MYFSDMYIINDCVQFCRYAGFYFVLKYLIQIKYLPSEGPVTACVMTTCGVSSNVSALLFTVDLIFDNLFTSYICCMTVLIESTKNFFTKKFDFSFTAVVSSSLTLERNHSTTEFLLSDINRVFKGRFWTTTL